MRVLVDYSKLLDYKETTNLDGAQGFCFVKEPYIYKIYYEPRVLKDDFSHYKSDSISFPICYLYDKFSNFGDQIVGEQMKFLPGKSILWSINENTKINNFIISYNKMIAEIRKYSEILMNDLGYPNILYDDERGFFLIDTTSWVINGDKNNAIVNLNMFNGAINETILNEFFQIPNLMFGDNQFFNHIKNYGEDGKNLYNLLIECFKTGEWPVIDILELFRNVFEKMELGPVETFSDVKKYTKILKNS